MEDQLKTLIYELKGMVEMVNCQFELDEVVSYSQFELVRGKVNEIVSKIEK
ncbi:hypothetical protein [Anaerobacillus arseniciselenatis]|uniref:hypothetical protein n=1 Tax=Anaerobacillus arseniciselenatis TaxID=85682 RepID=UPI001470CA40|nr:hypothetical protein [Anaerobacillus arseniciselenatis]